MQKTRRGESARFSLCKKGGQGPVLEVSAIESNKLLSKKQLRDRVFVSKSFKATAVSSVLETAKL
jgi:hypothetical protein